MFHVMLVLLPIIFLVVFGAILLFGFASILAGVLGGASAALFIKHKTIKKLLLIGFSILLLVGFLCLVPFSGMLSPALIDLRAMIGMAVLIMIAILTVVGIKISACIQNKTGKSILIILFSLTGVAAVVLFLVILSFWLG